MKAAHISLIAVLLVICLFNPTLAQQIGTAVQVDPTQIWTDTGLSFEEGQKIIIHILGGMAYEEPHDNAIPWSGPEGRSNPADDRNPLPGAPVNCVIRKFGEDGQIYRTTSPQIVWVDNNQNLFLGVNDWGTDDNAGLFIALIYTADDLTTINDEGIIPHGLLNPGSFDLDQNYPNPFNPDTRIDYTIRIPGQVALNIYDETGRIVRELVNGRLASGTYSLNWDGTDEQGRRLPSGTYFYAILNGDKLLARKAVMLK